jgi:hypothetical protein
MAKMVAGGDVPSEHVLERRRRETKLRRML